MTAQSPSSKQIIIYTDGCCEPNPSDNMGIGVYSDIGISISRPVRQPGTNNVAECLAVIAALEETKRRGLRGVIVKSDSMLVVKWVDGRFQCKSRTARKYTPVIRQLLDEVDGSISWCPGHKNLADPLSRQHVELPRSSSHTDMLEFVAATPMARLRFRDFARLKSGRDEFSRLRLTNGWRIGR